MLSRPDGAFMPPPSYQEYVVNPANPQQKWQRGRRGRPPKWVARISGGLPTSVPARRHDKTGQTFVNPSNPREKWTSGRPGRPPAWVPAELLRAEWPASRKTYLNPADPTQCWSEGQRGRRPNWVLELLADERTQDQGDPLPVSRPRPRRSRDLFESQLANWIESDPSAQ